MNHNAVAIAVASIAELGKGLLRNEELYGVGTVVGVCGILNCRPLIRDVRIRERRSVFGNGGEVELIDIDGAYGQKETAAAHISGAEHNGVRQLNLITQVEVVDSRRTLRMQHGVERGAEIVGIACRICNGLHDAIGEWIIERVQDDGIALKAAEIRII